MVFSSIFFTFLFLPEILVLYYLTKEKYRNYVLLAASLLFYAYGEPRFVFVMMISIVVNYMLARRIDSLENDVYQKLLLGLTVIYNLGILFVCKYLDFSIDICNFLMGTGLRTYGIRLPIGISFFTFQILSYVIDVYRKKAEPQKNIFYMALYISFFPQLIAGPIVRYNTVTEQIKNRKETIELFGSGVQRFMLGFCKKILLANNLAVVSEQVFSGDIVNSNACYLWLGALSFSLQIYYDFSGYSDMAIGLGRMFGFRFEENFRYPYISKSVTEFWRRWHISLGQWFRDYVYIPLGGSRVGKARAIFNLFVVWVLTGLWHGANTTFVAWGLGFFVLLLFEKFVLQIEKKNSKIVHALWMVVTLLCVNFGWVIFNSKSLRQGIVYCLGMIGYYGNRFVLNAECIRILREYGFFILTGVIFATPLAFVIGQRMNSNDITKKLRIYINPLLYSILFLWAVSFLIIGAHNPFIYFNF